MSGKTVWMASYPKSGTTWLRAVYTACRRGRVDLDRLDGGRIASSRRLFDLTAGVPSSLLTTDEIDRLRPRVDEAIDAREPDVHWRKVHDGFFAGPAGEPVVSVAAGRCALYLVRDPRDVAVSFAHHLDRPLEWVVDHLADPAGTSDSRPDRLEPQLRQRYGSWSSHVRSWLDQDRLPVHLVRYEDCVADPVATFAAALRAGGAIAGEEAEEEVAAAVRLSAFHRLRAQEDAGGFPEKPVTPSPFFRRGRAGTWRHELPAPLADRVAADHAEVMGRLGYLER